MEANIIKNCWENTGLFSECSSNMSGLDFVLVSEYLQLINGMLEQIVPQDKRMSIKELLCPMNEDNCIKTVTDGNLVEEIGFQVNSGDGECKSHGNTVIHLTLLEKQIEAIVLIKLVAEQRMLQDPVGFKFLSRLQRQLKYQVVTSRKLTRITSFFNEQWNQ